VQDGETSVLFSTHITSDLDSISDHVVVLNKGEVILTAGTDELRARWGVIKSPVLLLPPNMTTSSEACGNMITDAKR